jgi:hypothetical protein
MFGLFKSATLGDAHIASSLRRALEGQFGIGGCVERSVCRWPEAVKRRTRPHVRSLQLDARAAMRRGREMSSLSRFTPLLFV